MEVGSEIGLHNHNPPNTFVGHSFARKLTKDEKKFIADFSVVRVKLKDILCELKRRH